MGLKVGDKVRWQNLVYWAEGEVTSIAHRVTSDEHCEECGHLISPGGTPFATHYVKIERHGMLNDEPLDYQAKHASEIGSVMVSSEDQLTKLKTQQQ